MRKFFARLRKQRGFTLIEMMIVVAILGILATVSATLVSVLFTANLRSSQFGSQQTTIENTFGFLSSKLSLMQYSDLGVSESLSGTVDPLSLAGDQIMFASSYAGSKVCYRLMYLAALGEIRVASVEGPCQNNEAIKPRRGPNAYLWNGGSQFLSPGESGFDAAIDAAKPGINAQCNGSTATTDCSRLAELKVWTLATGIENYNPDPNNWGRIPADLRSALPVAQGNDSSNNRFLPPFAFIPKTGGPAISWDLGNATTFFAPSAVAGIGGSYPSQGEDEVGALSLRALVAPSRDGQSYVSFRYYQQDYSLQQLCAIYEQSGAEAGGDLTGIYPNPTIAPQAIAWEQLSSNGSDPAFPYDTKETFTGGTLPGGATYTDILTYSTSDWPASDEIVPGRYLVVGSVLGSTVLSNNSATGIELSIAQQIGSTTKFISSTSGSAWPLVVTGVIENLDLRSSAGDPGDQVILRARSKTSTAVPTESPDRPIRLELYWLGPTKT